MGCTADCVVCLQSFLIGTLAKTLTLLETKILLPAHNCFQSNQCPISHEELQRSHQQTARYRSLVSVSSEVIRKRLLFLVETRAVNKYIHDKASKHGEPVDVSRVNYRV